MVVMVEMLLLTVVGGGEVLVVVSVAEGVCGSE